MSDRADKLTHVVERLTELRRATMDLSIALEGLTVEVEGLIDREVDAGFETICSNVEVRFESDPAPAPGPGPAPRRARAQFYVVTKCTLHGANNNPGSCGIYRDYQTYADNVRDHRTHWTGRGKIPFDAETESLGCATRGEALAFWASKRPGVATIWRA